MALPVPIDEGPDELREVLAPLRNGVSVALMSLGNAFAAGAIVRVAHSFLVREIFMVGDAPHYEKASMGMEKYETIVRVPDVAGLFEAVEGRPSTRSKKTERRALSTMRRRSPRGVVFLFGSERFGVPDEALDRADAIVGVPMYGINHSFPVAITAGMVLAEWGRRRYAPGTVVVPKKGSPPGFSL
jgi:tRNA G18 (ribose-2'-O)-methylase SpoU